MSPTNRAGSSPAKAACTVYQPFATLLEEEAALALTKAGTAGATVTEKDLPSLATALERYVRRRRVVLTPISSFPNGQPLGTAYAKAVS